MSVELNTILIGVLIALVGWIGSRLWAKMDALEKTVADMAVKNERDHGDVMRKISVIEERLHIEELKRK